MDSDPDNMDSEFSLFVETPGSTPPCDISDYSDSDVASLMDGIDASSQADGNPNHDGATSVVAAAEVTENPASLQLRFQPSSSRRDDTSSGQSSSRPIPKKRTIFFSVSNPGQGRSTDPIIDSSRNGVSKLVSEDPASNRFAEVVGNLNVLQVRGDECCHCKEPIKETTDGVTCSRDPTEDVNEQIEDLTINEHVEVHKLCGDCVIKAGAFAINNTTVIAGAGIGMNCVDPFCSRIFLISEMRHFFPVAVENELQDKIRIQNMEAFCRDNPNSHIVKCSQCGNQDLVDESIRFHECQRCKAYRCWTCGRRATKAHEIRSCEEMTRAEERPSRGFLIYNAQALKPPRFV